MLWNRMKAQPAQRCGAAAEGRRARCGRANSVVARLSCYLPRQRGEARMGERFERHRQAWRQDEIQKLHNLAGKGMSVRAIAKALTRSEESVKDRAKQDRLRIAKLR